ncbi:MAG: TonB-dependent receptor [Woeseia sp.]
MSRNTSLSVAVRRALSGVAIASTAASVPASVLAQEAEQRLEEITVTGSRIATDANLITSSPVTSVNPEELTYRGITRVEDLINDLPQITPELSANESNGATGTATLDLRGLGSDRTLVLVNGHRMGFGDPFALAPDVNQIPGALIERVELLTGGASSTYGSDAVAGVVNFIMKDDFEGFKIDYQFSGYQHNQGNNAVQDQIATSGFEQAPSNVRDGATMNVNLLVGSNTADGRGNVTGYLGYRNINAITQDQRDFSACALSSSNGETCGGSATSPQGLFTDFGVPGTVAGQTDAVFNAPTFYLTLDNTNEFVSGVPLYNYGPLNHFQRPDERYTAGLFGSYQIDEHFEGYAEMQFMDDRSLAQIAPSGAFFVTDTINCDNPFLSAQQFTAICENDRVLDTPDNPATADDEAALSAGIQDCASGAVDPCPLYIGRRNVEGGPRFDDLRHTSYRFLGGMRGEINDNWNYDVSANFSRLIFSETYNNDLSITRILRALDVVEDPNDPTNAVCASAVNGVDPNCVPWNVFEEGGVTQEAIDYLVLPLFSKADLNMDQIVGFVSGDLSDMGMVSPGAVDGVEVVAGFEYRGESFDFQPDQGFTSGDGAGQGGPTAAVSGSQNIKEFFAEARIPLMQDRPGFQDLSLDLRYRNSDYSTGVSADTYNIGGSWAPNETVKVRGGFSRAVRAANIRELFEPQNLGLWGGTDPCAGPTPVQSQAECANSGVSAGQYGTIPLSPAGQYNQISGGNPDLDPEKSDSITVGFVVTPDAFLPGLTFSVDYWSIEVEDAIATVDPEFIVEQCNITADPALCNLVQRGPNGNLWIGQNAFVTSTNVNIGFFDVAGVDIVANYGLETNRMGGFDFSLRGTWLEKFDQQQVPGAEIENCAGAWGGSCGRPRPEWKHTFNTVWSTPWDGTSITGGWRYVGAVDAFNDGEPNVDGEHYIDLSASYTASWFGDERPTTIYGGVSNALDNDPPVSGFFGNVSVYGNGNTIPATWDALGRYYFVGFSQEF